MNINNIITESINKIIIEAVNNQFQELWNRGVKLHQYRFKIHQTNLKATNNKQIIGFLGHEFYHFIAELEAAIKRCYTARNINESLADYGIQMPSELNAWNNAQQYYYNMKNMLNGREGNNMVNQYSGKAKRGRRSSRARAGRNEKLLYLLNTVWPPIQREFIVLHNQYNFNRICPAAIYAKSEIEGIIQIANNIKMSTNKNAQGQNP